MQITMFSIRKIIKIFIVRMGSLVHVLRMWQREMESGFSKSNEANLVPI